MRYLHKITASIILLISTSLAFYFELRLTERIAQNLIIFYSVGFGFQMIAIAILCGSFYFKKLHKQILEEKQKRRIHILKDYVLVSGYWSIFTITAIIVFSTLNMNLFLSSILFGIAAVNIYFLMLWLNFIADAIIEGAKQGG